MVVRGNHAFPSRTATGIYFGTAMMRRVGQSTTTERGFALILDRGGMRRVWLRGRDNVQKRYLIHVAGYNLGLLMRLLTGAGTPREFIAMVCAQLLAILQPAGSLIVMIFVCCRQSVRRIRRHDQTNPTRLNQRAVCLGAKFSSGLMLGW